jgi:hypothetical protein
MENELERSLDELITRYDLEPELCCDIYVEGNTDKHLIEWFLEKEGYQYFAIYEINTVYVPKQKLCVMELDNNNRSRVIALALEMQNQLSVTPLHLTCIADKDFDELFKRHDECECLLFTDYSSIEMYLFKETVINKFLHLVVRLSKIQARDIINNLSPILEELFLIRATNEALKWGMEWLPFDTKNCIKLNQDKINIEFKGTVFIEKYLSKNSKLSQKSVFMNKLEELKLQSDSLTEKRLKIRGHDFIDVLHWYIIKRFTAKKKAFSHKDTIGTSLLGCIEVTDLKSEKLFRHLLTRIEK